MWNTSAFLLKSFQRMARVFHIMTYLNYTSDQFTGLGGLVIPGTIRDSVYVLEALLEQESGLTPIEIMSDTASYSDLMFGLFWCLGYQFSPRLAEMKETRFWRIDPTANYGPLNGLARHRINTRLITTNWDDILIFSRVTMGA